MGDQNERTNVLQQVERVSLDRAQNTPDFIGVTSTRSTNTIISSSTPWFLYEQTHPSTSCGTPFGSSLVIGLQTEAVVMS